MSFMDAMSNVMGDAAPMLGKKKKGFPMPSGKQRQDKPMPKSKGKGKPMPKGKTKAKTMPKSKKPFPPKNSK